MNRTALVTGATRGVGLAVAQRLTKAGWSVIGCARTPVDDFDGVFVAVDLAETAAAEVVNRIAADHTIDLCVNNASSAVGRGLDDIAVADLDRLMTLNVTTPIRIAQAIVPGMRARGWGRIVNISSLAALGANRRTEYAAAKGALEAMTRSLGRELAPSGITVNAIAPGAIDTDLLRAHHPHGSESRARWVDSIPVGRLASVDDVAACVGFLASDDAAYITGQVIRVDGGASIGAGSGGG